MGRSSVDCVLDQFLQRSSRSFHHFTGGNPFGFSSTNLGSLYKGLVKDTAPNFKHLRRTKHTHHPVDDAKGNAEALLTIAHLVEVERALGWDARTADVIVGTSAGAELAMLLGAGVAVTRILAAALGRPLVVTDGADGTALGAAALALYGLGEAASLREALIMLGADPDAGSDELIPDPDDVAAYRAIRAQIPALLARYDEVRNLFS